MKYSVQMGSGATIHTKFHKDWFKHKKLIEGDMQTHTHTQYDDCTSLHLYLGIKKTC
jgi:hypothetical protein